MFSDVGRRQRSHDTRLLSSALEAPAAGPEENVNKKKESKQGRKQRFYHDPQPEIHTASKRERSHGRTRNGNKERHEKTQNKTLNVQKSNISIHYPSVFPIAAAQMEEDLAAFFSSHIVALLFNIKSQCTVCKYISPCIAGRECMVDLSLPSVLWEGK